MLFAARVSRLLPPALACLLGFAGFGAPRVARRALRAGGQFGVHQLAVAGAAGDAGADCACRRFRCFADYSARIVVLLRQSGAGFCGRLFRCICASLPTTPARLTAVGLALLAATALSLMLTIERNFNAIWRVHAPRPFVAADVDLLGDASPSPAAGRRFVGAGPPDGASALERQVPALADALQWLASLGLTTLVLMALYALTPTAMCRANTP